MELEAPLNQARGGDVKAIVELTRRFQHAVYGSALTLVRDFQAAEDVVQEAFVAAWAGMPSLAEPAAFPGWLCGTRRSGCYGARRRRDSYWRTPKPWRARRLRPSTRARRTAS
ncbi:MAG: sigma factor [Alphaproteobacteria bacterium]